MADSVCPMPTEIRPRKTQKENNGDERGSVLWNWEQRSCYEPPVAAMRLRVLPIPSPGFHPGLTSKSPLCGLFLADSISISHSVILARVSSEATSAEIMQIVGRRRIRTEGPS